MIAYAEMAEEDKRNILGINALRLLDLQPWFHRDLLRCTRPPAAA